MDFHSSFYALVQGLYNSRGIILPQFNNTDRLIWQVYQDLLLRYNPAGISPGSVWYFYVQNVLCLLRWIILPGSPQDQIVISMYYVYSAGISPESLRPAGISPGSSFWALCIMFTPLDNPAGISPGSAWYFNVLCLLCWNLHGVSQACRDLPSLIHFL